MDILWIGSMRVIIYEIVGVQDWSGNCVCYLSGQWINPI